MKLQRTAVHSSPAMAATKGKLAPSSGKIKAAARSKQMLPHNGEDRLEKIRQQAYALYTARNCVEGYELEDWLRAEALVDQISAQQASTSQPML